MIGGIEINGLLRFHVCRSDRAYASDQLQVLCHTAGRNGVLHLQLA